MCVLILVSLVKINVFKASGGAGCDIVRCFDAKN